jgi:prophage regulatory protein
MKTKTQTHLFPMDNLSILRLQEVIFRTGLSRTRLYDMIAKGKFPHPISLSTRTVGWIEGEIASWIADRVGISRKSK